ncbi:MAG: RsmD family RNA methyltransferase [Polyangiales bacterium]
MRIISGTLRGRRFQAPPGRTTRPTLERAREALASALDARGYIAGRQVLDLFAGSGALSYELLSRGAAYAVMVDQGRQAARTIQHNRGMLGLTPQSRLLGLDLLAAPFAVAQRLAHLPEAPFDVVLMDPPYVHAGHMPALLSALLDAEVLKPSCAVMVEHPSKAPLQLDGRLDAVRVYPFGETTMLVGWRT